MSLEQSEGRDLPKRNIHFTYKNVMDKSTLCQGDVLKITDEIKDILKKVHPYFLREEYKYFIVLTQSCDLVKRNGKTCKTPYITLAPVRKYDGFLEKKLVEGKYAEQVDGFLLMDSKNRERAYQLVERIYNNTESDYFFLYKEEALGFPESMIVPLKVSFALRSEEHYEHCLNAKIIELSDEFKAKLGWMVGYIYSRVGTTDWESIKTKTQREEMLNEELSSRCVIGSKEQVKEFRKMLTEKKEEIKSHEDAIIAMTKIPNLSKYDKTIAEIEAIFNNTCKSIPQDEKTKLLNAIKSRSSLKSLIS